MTTILWYDDMLYADSRIEKNGEWFNALNKVHQIKDPFPIKSDTHQIDDVVLGWTSSGSMTAAQGFVNKLLKFSKDKEDEALGYCNFDTVTKYYMEIWRDNMVSTDNLFEVILIGAKSNYCYRFDPEPLKPLYKPYPHTAIWGMGTGARTAVDAAAEKYKDGFKGFLEAILKDPYSGGMLEVWALLRETNKETGEEKVSFQRIMFSDPLSDDEIMKALRDEEDAATTFKYVERRIWTKLLGAMAELTKQDVGKEKSNPTERGDAACQQKPHSKPISRKSSRKPKGHSKRLVKNSK